MKEIQRLKAGGSIGIFRHHLQRHIYILKDIKELKSSESKGFIL
ncbi:hypothetical protein [Abyssisolibacter fermentans]|nr:hypothetical protein [Abyssisolibacter fermentans]